MNRLGRKFLKKKPAQQLIEFLLVAPFVVIILGVLTEYAYALNVNMTLTEGLKTATSSLYSELRPNMPATDIKTMVEENLISYLSANNVPLKESNTIRVGYATVGDNTVFMASYKYIPAFTLPNIYFHILPEEFNFFATSLVPSAFLNGNSAYASGVDSLTLDGIWKGSNFSGMSTYDGVRNGVMNLTKTGKAGVTNKIAFLVPIVDSTLPDGILYAVVPWSGEFKSGSFVLDFKDERMYVYDGSQCNYTGSSYTGYMDSFSSIIFVHDSALTDNDISVIETTLKDQWVTGSGTKISDKTTDGALKRTMALVNTAGFSIGNYDNINVFAYNPGVSTGNSYSMISSEDKILIYTSSDAVGKVD